MVLAQVSFQLPDKPSGNGMQTSVRFQGLIAVLRMVPKTLVPVNLLEHKRIALTQRKIQRPYKGQYLFHYLLMQLRIRGIDHVLFLYRRIDEGRVVMIPVIILRVDADTFRKYEFHAALTDTLAEMDQLARIAGIGRSKFHLPAEILVVSVFTALFHYRLV